ncbi:uncharacterized protein [Aquarana catesbeiana]|uniref:uncharacterized protein n=1 Tax=Aquarana catesbeiana TaxID=8400 RepID=UPI003CCA3DAC
MILIIIYIFFFLLHTDFPWKPEVCDIPVPNLFNGNTATLKCEVSNVFPKVLSVKWLKKKKDSEHKFPLSQNDGYNISDLTPEKQKDNTFTYKACIKFKPSIADEGEEFICRVEHPYLKEPVEKSTGPLTIEAKPTVSGPIKLSLTDSEEVLCSLDIEKFYPRNIQIKWNDKETSDCGKISQNDDRTYTINSEYKLPGSFFSHPDSVVRVSWKHDSMEDWESREMSVLDKDFPWKPEVCDIPVPNLFNRNTATLKCEVSNVFPKVLSVKWLKKKKDSEHKFPLSQNDGYNISELTPEKQKDNTFTYKACIKFKPSITDEGEEFICRVEHPYLKEPVEKSTGPLTIEAKPTVSGPIKLSLTDSEEVLCSLDIEKFYPRNIQIKWNDKETSDCGKISQNDDRTYTINSEYKLPGNFFSLPDSVVRVSWKHDSMEDWESREMSVLDKDFPWKPEVCDIPVPNLFYGNTATLKCEVSNVFPKVLSVKWLKKKKDSEHKFPLSQNDGYNISDLTPEKQKDNTFTYKACIQFKPSIADEGEEFICRVEHLYLKEPVEKSTGPLTIEADQLRFIVGKIQGPRRWIHGEKVALYISLFYCSEDTGVMWMVEMTDGKVEEISSNGGDPLTDSGYTISKESEESDKEVLFNITSSLTFVSSVSRHPQVTFACKITSDEQTKTVKFQPESIYAKPQALGPVKTSLCDNGDVLCSLNLQKFYPRDVELSWRSGEDKLESREKYEENNDGTFNGNSHCTVPGKLLLNPNFTLHVTWNHKSLDGQQSQVLSWRDLEPEQQNQLPQYEDNQEAYQDHNSATTMVKTGEDDWEVPSDPGETNLDTPGVTYVKNKQKPSFKLHGSRYPMYDEKDQEKKRRNPETKKRASDRTMNKLQHLSLNSSDNENV